MKQLTNILLTVFLLSSISAWGQQSNNAERQKRWDEMIAKRNAYFTERIGFTPSEAQAFWPVYNELQMKKGQLHSKMRTFHRNAKTNEKGERIPDFEKITDEMVHIKVQEATLEKEYHLRFKTILSPEKIFKLYQAERDWAGELLKDLQERGGRPNR